MAMAREPILHPVPIEELRPTQITVGMREVKAKRKAWRATAEAHGEKAGKFLGNHMMPAVRGPRGRFYVIDHHHLSLALYEEGVKDVLVTAVADLSRLDGDSFWFVMDCHDWMHPFDEDGKRRGYEDIPKSIKDLVDDPFRSLAGELRRAGGFAKDTTPFSEFLWADFLRRRLKRKEVDRDFDAALEKSLEFAKSKDADYLPGWCGRVAE
ncbi:ParB-like protein [Rhizobium mayense]|uniref:ParB-like protein n=1 Tax=Rhizobium mayense TaxID=1312184 RepID=A0ABT7JNU2_9HYPH|nr:ParB-like protein [Rhizobium mayense]MDL2398019.1 ParB-like protein [Rhizobium mayense]